MSYYDDYYQEQDYDDYDDIFGEDDVYESNNDISLEEQTEVKQEENKPMSSEWIRLEEGYDPFSEDGPQEGDEYIFWNTNDKKQYMNTFRSNQHKPSRGWSHYHELLKPPVVLLEFTDVIKGLKQGKKYQRKGWAASAFVDGKLAQRLQTLSVEAILAKDWIEM